jgi:RNA polymerase sigma factor (sigma-70 family)
MSKVPSQFAASQEHAPLWTVTFKEWWSRAYALVYNRLRQRFDAGLAEEVLVDALTSAWGQGEKQGDYFLSFAHFCNWVRQTASWRARDSLRRKGRLRGLPEEREKAQLDDTARAVRQATADADIRLRLEECLRRLPEQEQLLLTEHYQEGKTDVELGQRLFGETASPQALGLRAWRLRKKALGHLRQLMLAEDIAPEHWQFPTDP